MPFIPAIAGAIYSALSFVAITGSAAMMASTALAYGIVSGALYAASALLTKKPSSQSFINGIPLQNTMSVGDTIRLVYGCRRIGGTRLFVWSTGIQNKYLHMIIGWGEGPVKGPLVDGTGEMIWLDDRRMQYYQTYKGLNLVYHEFHKGTHDQTVSTELQSYIPSWNEAMRFTAYSYFRFKYNATAWGSLPNVTCVMEGNENIFDPRSGSHGYSRNGVLIARDFATHPRYGGGVQGSLIQKEAVIVCANWVDDASHRYYFDGVIQDRQPFADNMQDILANFKGEIIWSGSGYKFIIYKWDAPILDLDFDETMLLANQTGKNALSIDTGAAQDTPKRIKGYFSDPRDNYNVKPVYWPQVAPDVAETDKIAMEFSLIGTCDYGQALRILKYHYLRARFSRTFAFAAHPKMYPAELGDIFRASRALSYQGSSIPASWYHKPLRVQKIAMNQANQIAFSVIEEDSSIYDEEVHIVTHAEFKPVLPGFDDATSIPQNLVATSGEDTRTERKDDAYILFRWDKVPGITSYGLRYRKSDVPRWTNAGDLTDEGDDPNYFYQRIGGIEISKHGETYTYYWEAWSIDGNHISEHAIPINLIILWSPGAISTTGLSITATAKPESILVKINAVYPFVLDDILDFLIYKSLEPYFTYASYITTQSKGTSVDFTDLNVIPTGTYWYWVKAKDKGGQESAVVGPTAGVSPLPMVEDDKTPPTPNPPTGMAATYDVYHVGRDNKAQLNLSWNPCTDDSGKDVSYEVHIREEFTSDFDVKPTKDPLISPIGYDVRKTYVWKVRSYDWQKNYTEFCDDQYIPIGDDTNPPSMGLVIFSATGVKGQINLTWSIMYGFDVVADLKEWLIYRNTVDSFPGDANIHEIEARQVRDHPDKKGLVEGQTYYYWLKARDETGNLSTTFSGPVSAIATEVVAKDEDPPIPNPPIVFSSEAFVERVGKDTIMQARLIWHKCTDEYDLDKPVGYEVHFWMDEDEANVKHYPATKKSAATAPEYFDLVVKGLAPWTKYWWKVAAYDWQKNYTNFCDPVSFWTYDEYGIPLPPSVQEYVTEGQVFHFRWLKNGEPDMEKYNLYVHTSRLLNDPGSAKVIQRIAHPTTVTSVKIGTWTEDKMIKIEFNKAYHWWMTSEDTSHNESAKIYIGKLRLTKGAWLRHFSTPWGKNHLKTKTYKQSGTGTLMYVIPPRRVALISGYNIVGGSATYSYLDVSGQRIESVAPTATKVASPADTNGLYLAAYDYFAFSVGDGWGSGQLTLMEFDAEDGILIHNASLGGGLIYTVPKGYNMFVTFLYGWNLIGPPYSTYLSILEDGQWMDYYDLESETWNVGKGVLYFPERTSLSMNMYSFGVMTGILIKPDLPEEE